MKNKLGITTWCCWQKRVGCRK